MHQLYNYNNFWHGFKALLFQKPLTQSICKSIRTHRLPTMDVQLGLLWLISPYQWIHSLLIFPCFLHLKIQPLGSSTSNASRLFLSIQFTCLYVFTTVGNDILGSSRSKVALQEQSEPGVTAGQAAITNQDSVPQGLHSVGRAVW